MKKLILFFGLLMFIPLTANAFTDVASSDRYQKAVNLVEQQGIVGGYDDGTFRPDSDINRAELLKIIIMSKYGPEVVDNCIDENIPAKHSYAFFTDVPKNAWFAKFVCVAKEQGIVKGYTDGTFRPSQNITFVEGLKITAKAYEVAFTEDGIWYEDVVNKAAADNLIPLTINRFDKEMTRGEMADMIARYSESEKGNLDNYLGYVKAFKVDFNSLQKNQNIETQYRAHLNLQEEDKSITAAEEAPLVLKGPELEVEEETPILAGGNEIVWTAVDIGAEEHLNVVFFYDEDNGWIGGDGPSLYRTTDGGEHWETLVKLDSAHNGFTDISFQSAQNGWMTQSNNEIHKTTDGGENWDERGSDGFDSALCYSYETLNIFSGKMYALGSAGYGYSSTNGVDWDRMSTATGESLYDSYFVTPSVGYAVGANGRIIKMTNGGNWDLMDSGTFANLRGVHFTSSTKGWAVGDDGTLLKTTNGGSSWTEYDESMITDFNDVYFIDSNTGWIVGSQMILKTTDAGQSWHEIDNHPAGTAKSVHFTSNSHGWAVGYNGFVIKTTSGNMPY